MGLVQLIYVSTVTNKLDDNELHTLLNTAQSNNSRDDITGLLLASEHYFMQCIEGDAHAINMLYKKLIDDARHFNVTLMSYNSVPNRFFAEWSMALVAPADTSIFLAAKLNGETFSPYHMTSAECLTLLLQIKHFYASNLVAIQRAGGNHSI